MTIGCLGVVAGARDAHASALDLFGFGARGSSMGNSLGADAHGFEAVYYNPAGLAFDLDRTFTLGFQRGDFLLDVNGDRQDILEAPALLIGFGIPVPLGGFLERRLVLGLGFVLPQTSILIADSKRPGDLSYVLLENRAQTVSIQGGLGIRFTDWLSAGWGMLALAELDGAIDVAPNAAGRLGSQARDQLVADYSSVYGLQLRPLDALSVGLVYRSESSAEYTLPIDTDLGESFPLPVPTLNIVGTAQYDPAAIELSVAGRPVSMLLLAAGARWKQWSRFPNPIAYTSLPPDYPEQPAPNFADTFVWNVGAEARLNLAGRLLGNVFLLPRLGFVLEPSPAPEQTGLHNYLDSDRAISSAGLGFELDRFRVDSVFQWQRLSERTHEKDCTDDGETGLQPPMDEVPTIPTTYPDPNPGCPSVTHGGNIFFWGVEVGVRL